MHIRISQKLVIAFALALSVGCGGSSSSSDGSGGTGAIGGVGGSGAEGGAGGTGGTGGAGAEGGTGGAGAEGGAGGAGGVGGAGGAGGGGVPCGVTQCIGNEVCFEDRCVQCGIDSDCGENGLCVDNICRVACDDDAGCAEQQACANGICIDVECRGDEQCPDGVCLDYACVGCRVVDDCADQDCGSTPCQCLENACVGCNADDQCADGFCVNTRCEECRDNADCGDGDFCVLNACVDCRDNGDCADGNICLDDLCQPPPPGDSCAEPIMYEFGSIARGNTAIYAPLNAGSCQGAEAPDVVHAFQAPEDGTVCATTRGSDYDTALYVFETECNGANELDCNDDDNDWEIADGTRSTVEFAVTAGQTYYLVVDGWSGASGNYILSTSLGACADVIPPSCIGDDDCVGDEICRAGNCGLACDEETPCVGNALCEEGACRAVECLDDAGCVNNFFDNRCDQNRCVECAVDDHCDDGEVCRANRCRDACQVDADCMGFSPEACVEGACTVVDCLEDDDCFNGVCADQTCIECRNGADCDDDACGGRPCLCAEATCVACVEDADCGDGSFCNQGSCRDCRDDADCADGSCINGYCLDGGDTCEDPLAYELGTVVRGINEPYSGTTRGSCAGRGREIIYSFSAAAAGTVCLTTRDSNYDTSLYVRAGECDGGMEVACNDDDRFEGSILDVGNRSTVEFNVIADQTYFVFVDAFSEFGLGNYVLSSSIGACAANVPPVCIDNDDCPFSNVCRNNACEFFCEDNDACGARELCQAGACVEVDCRVDDQCANGICLEDNTCAPCREAADCGELACNGGACVCADNQCVQCAADGDCADGVCSLGGVLANQCVACVETAQCAEGEICFDNACVAQPEGGGLCEAPIAYALGQILTGSLANGLSRDSAVGCGGAGAGPEKVHTFTVQEDTEVCFQTRGSNLADPVLYIRDTACTGPDANEVACNDNSPAFAGGFQSAVSINAVAGVEYFIMVDSFFIDVAAGGDQYVLTSRVGPCEGDAIPVCAADADCLAGTCDAGECVAEMQPPIEGDTTAFFSEYIEGSSFNKAVEIYNAGAAAIDLNTCSINLYSNGAQADDADTIGLGADDQPTMLAPGAVYTLCNGRADQALLDVCDQTSGSLNHNGDDTIALVCGGTVLDVIGQIGFDPGNAWSSDDASTLDSTLRRNCDVQGGDASGDDAFDPSAQWTGFPVDTFDGIGNHCL